MALTNERALTKQQQAFVDAYICDPEMNATDCVRKAYPNCKYPDKLASQLLGNTRVKAAIQKAMDERSKRTNITADMVLKEYAKLGFSNITDYLKVEETAVVVDFIGEGDSKKPIMQNVQTVRIFDTDSIDRVKLDAVAEIKQTKDGISLKLHDKKGALDSIAKHLGMFIDEVKHSGAVVQVHKRAADLTDEELEKIAYGSQP